jgi:hypothetical protein
VCVHVCVCVHAHVHVCVCVFVHVCVYVCVCVCERERERERKRVRVRERVRNLQNPFHPSPSSHPKSPLLLRPLSLPVLGSEYFIHNGLLSLQGPNYALAKTMQNWRVIISVLLSCPF